MWLNLKVHASQGALSTIKRNVRFHQSRIHPPGAKFRLRPTSCEEAALVFKSLDINYQGARQFRVSKDQSVPRAPAGASTAISGGSTTLTLGTGIIKRPPRRRYSSCCSKISSAKFQVSSNT